MGAAECIVTSTVMTRSRRARTHTCTDHMHPASLANVQFPGPCLTLGRERHCSVRDHKSSNFGFRIKSKSQRRFVHLSICHLSTAASTLDMSDPVQPSGTTGTSPSPAAGPAAPTSGPPIAPPSTTSSSSSSGRIPGPASGAATAAGSAPKPPLPPLTGFRAALEHTGLPRGVLTYKPKLPSRKWLLFWSVLGTVSYIYYDDRRRAKNIKAEYIKKVEHFARQPVEGGSLGMVRTVQVLAARWPEDDDADRGGRYFRKYLKVSREVVDTSSADYQGVS